MRPASSDEKSAKSERSGRARAVTSFERKACNYLLLGDGQAHP